MVSALISISFLAVPVSMNVVEFKAPSSICGYYAPVLASIIAKELPATSVTLDEVCGLDHDGPSTSYCVP